MKAGYQGKDAMREQAEKAFGKSLKGVSAPAKTSASAPEKLKPRLYKKGGSVKAKKYNLGGAANPHPMGAQALPQDSSKKQMGFKKGGSVKAKKCADGGYMNSFNTDNYGINPNGMYTGGARPKYGESMKKSFSTIAEAVRQPGNNQAPQALVNQVQDPNKVPGFKKGGKVKKMAMGGVGKLRHNEIKKVVRKKGVI